MMQATGLREQEMILLTGPREPIKMSAHGLLMLSAMSAMRLLMPLTGLAEHSLTLTIG